MATGPCFSGHRLVNLVSVATVGVFDGHRAVRPSDGDRGHRPLLRPMVAAVENTVRMATVLCSVSPVGC